MKQQFSPNLLYSVSPENFPELHLRDDTDEFEWEEQRTRFFLLVRELLSTFIMSAVR